MKTLLLLIYLFCGLLVSQSLSEKVYAKCGQGLPVEKSVIAVIVWPLITINAFDKEEVVITCSATDKR